MTDLRDAKGSVEVGVAEVIPLAACGQERIAPFARAQARIAFRRCQQCSNVEGMRHGIRVFRESPQGEGAHLTRAFFVWQQIFYITDERSYFCSRAEIHIRRTRFDATHRIKCATVVPCGHKEPASLRAFFSFRPPKKETRREAGSSGGWIPACAGMMFRQSIRVNANAPSHHLILPSL